MLGSELLEDDFSSMLDVVKCFRVDVWELRKGRLCDENLTVPVCNFICETVVCLGWW